MRTLFRSTNWLILIIAIVLLGTSCTVKNVSTLPQPVQIQNGKVEGIKSANSNVVVYKGIPYAAPPVGEFRWKEPQPPLSWEGVYVADKFCSSCIQNITGARNPWTDEFMSHDSISEDCLFLNIWTPAKSSSDKLPVLVYIHGGAFNEGSGSILVYDGEELAKKGIIVVTINYRLGVLGFLAHPELTKESPNNASGNYGLLDQVAALKWIKTNIAAFGGDPGRVTIDGQSAGASSVNLLVASPLAKGLFTGAIAESGSSFSALNSGTKLADAEASGLKFAEAKGAKSISDLRSMSYKELTAALPQGTAPIRFGAVVDGWFLPEPINVIFSKAGQNDVPIITGYNADEGSSSPAYGKSTLKEFKESASARYKEQSSKYLSLYNPTTDVEAGLISKEAARDQSRVSMFLWAKNRAKTAKTNAYTYFFDQAIPWPEHPEFGAFHTSEVPYVFNNLKMMDRPWTKADSTVADMVSSYWVNFVTTGNPNGNGLPVWTKFDSTSTTTMRLGITPGPIPVAEGAKFDFLNNFISRPQ